MEPGVILRRARRLDAEALADVWLRSRSASIPSIPAPVHSDADVRRYFTEVVLPTKDVWVALSPEGAVGMMALDGSWVEHLYIDPGWWGRGVGSHLVALAKRHCPEGLDLWTFQSNDGAKRFYERHGFVVIGSTDGDNEEGAPDLHYRWDGTCEA